MSLPDSSRILPPATAAFLEQIADIPGASGAGLFRYASSVLLPATGWSEEEFLARLTADLSRSPNLGILERSLEDQSRGVFSPFSLSLVAAGGERVNILALPRPGATPHGKEAVTVSLAAQAAGGAQPPAVVADQSRILRLFDVMPAYVILIDREYIIRFSNRVGRRLFGPIVGMPCHKALYGRDTPCVPCQPFAVLTDNTAKVHEWVNGRINTAFRAHSYPFEDTEGNKLVLQIGLNITAGVRARHALDLSEQRYRSIAENLTMGLALVDPALNVVTLNPMMETWFGEGAVRGSPICDILHRRCCEEGDGVCVFRKVLHSRENREKEFELPTAGGEARYFRLIACPIVTRGNIVQAIVLMLEDMTDRRNLAERVQQVQRLEAMGSLAAGIAHEINQPLSALHLYASGLQMLLEQGEASSDRVLERLALILAQADKIRQIISHMRALVMQEENPPVVASSIGQAVADALNLLGAQMREHGITVMFEPAGETPSVLANPVQLEQIVINILINAMHALDTVDRDGKRIRIATESGDGTASLIIADNGPGLDGVRERIFDPFFTTKGAHAGMGLGLSIAHAFVAGWGGTIDAQSNVGESGACFRVTLPTAGDGPGDAPPPDLSA